MPITKSAIKKQKVDKVRTRVNRTILSQVKTAEKNALARPATETLSRLYSSVDVAVKKHVLKANTAARIKAGVVRALKAKLSVSPFAKSK